MGQGALGTCDFCASSEVVTLNEVHEKVCESCALDHHVCATAARVVPAHSEKDGTSSLYISLASRDGSEIQSRQMTTAEMQSFITRAQEALNWARAMEADDGE
jgi:hypothetical protein